MIFSDKFFQDFSSSHAFYSRANLIFLDLTPIVILVEYKLHIPLPVLAQIGPDTALCHTGRLIRVSC